MKEFCFETKRKEQDRMHLGSNTGFSREEIWECTLKVKYGPFDEWGAHWLPLQNRLPLKLPSHGNFYLLYKSLLLWCCHDEELGNFGGSPSCPITTHYFCSFSLEGCLAFSEPAFVLVRILSDLTTCVYKMGPAFMLFAILGLVTESLLQIPSWLSYILKTHCEFPIYFTSCSFNLSGTKLCFFNKPKGTVSTFDRQLFQTDTN